MSRRGRRAAPSLIRATLRTTPTLVQGSLAAVAVARLSRGRNRRGPLTVTPAARADALREPRISVVIPARDEAERIADCLAPLQAAPGVLELIVVDDRSTDATAEIAREFGARVLDGEPLAEGWIGKPWALQQGLVAARGELVVFLDADVRPTADLPLAIAGLLESGDRVRDITDIAPDEVTAEPADRPTPQLVERAVDLASAQLAFSHSDLGQRILHPALLATLIYRLGALDTVEPMPAGLAAINGQCFAVRRDALVEAGGFALIGGVSTDDVALARALAAAGWRIAVADGSAHGSVQMYSSAGEALREWAGRSLALPGAASPGRQWTDLAIIWAAQGLPGLRLWGLIARGALRGLGFGAAKRARLEIEFGVLPRRRGLPLPALDLGLLALRAALVLALGRVYRRGSGPDRAAFLAPLADPIAAVALTRGTFWPVRRWRGRDL